MIARQAVVPFLLAMLAGVVACQDQVTVPAGTGGASTGSGASAGGATSSASGAGANTPQETDCWGCKWLFGLSEEPANACAGAWELAMAYDACKCDQCSAPCGFCNDPFQNTPDVAACQQCMSEAIAGPCLEVGKPCGTDDRMPDDAKAATGG